ncbi:hypothetical protein [Paracoccus tegillarcae]|uniref:Uncharacterized protein n=1 Tax=Paracoccus tegillarcae TaxID=1529068 RepID=A0A2K9EI35_9RHOB|nr:hypothetical protein [Paracoccus tegillarcae]AUH34648.1 hypothetical protein CUV01_15785 [Paracoccus tegillarcae]
MSNPGSGLAKENPDALAGAIGADLQSWFDWIDNNTRRETAARPLCAAVAACDPRDRLFLLELLIEALRPGQPMPIFNAIMTEARDWAAWATRAELKAFCLASYEAMSGPDQAAFLGHLDRRAAA